MVFLRSLAIIVQVDDVDNIVELVSQAVAPFLSSSTGPADIVDVEIKGIDRNS